MRNMKKYIYGYLICAMLLMFGNYTNLSAQTSIEENNVVRADLNMMFARLLVQNNFIIKFYHYETTNNNCRITNCCTCVCGN